MRSEIDVLIKEFADLGLSPARLAQIAPGVHLVRADIAPGLECVFRLSEPSGELFDLVGTLVMRADIGDRLADVERVAMMLDDLIVPCRAIVVGDELGVSVHGSWSDAEGLVQLGLETVLVLRRLAIVMLAPLLELAEGRSTAEDAFTQILRGLGSDPLATPANALSSDEVRNV